MMIPTRDNLLGSIIGTAVGDALGMPLEFVSRSRLPDEPISRYYAGDVFNGPCGHLASGQWTDDTQMMIAILESLLNSNKVLVADIGEKFYAWANQPDRRFPGNACTTGALARQGVKTEGCGSIMRMLPLGFLVDRDDALEIGRMTHVSKECDKWVAFLHGAVRKGRKFSERFFNTEKTAWKGGNSAWVVDTGMCALKAVLETTGFKDAVVAAVNMGGDTDSIGAVAGGLAGAWYGLSSIDEDFLLTLERGSYLNTLGDMLYESFSERFE